MPSETAEICETAIAELKIRDPELHKALEHVIFWDDITHVDTLDDFKRRAAKQGARFAKIRAAMRPREFK